MRVVDGKAKVSVTQVAQGQQNVATMVAQNGIRFTVLDKVLKTVRWPFLAKSPGMENALREAARQEQPKRMGMER
jgi:hypothetical protein